MSDRTAELMRLCFEKVDLGGEDAVFFQNVMNALLEAEAESEAQGRRDEAHVWFDKWRETETLDPVWASDRLAILQQLVENRNVCGMAVTKEWAEEICNMTDDDPRVPLIEAKHLGITFAHLKQVATAFLARPETKEGS